MEKILINKGTSLLKFELRGNKKYLDHFLSELLPYKNNIVKMWLKRYESVFAKNASLKKIQRERIFRKWIGLLCDIIENRDMAAHYREMVKLGSYLSENKVPIEEIIFSVHFLEEVIFPIILKVAPDKKKLGNIVFSIDILFHNELACLTIAYFYKYKSHIDNLENMKEDLTHMIIHDMKNPISSIMIASSSLLKNFREKNKIDNVHYIEIINKLGNELWDMTNNLLDISKIENKKFKPDLIQNKMDEILKETIEMHKPVIEQKDIKLFTHIENIPKTYVDMYIIKRVIHNLIDNAIKYSPRGSEINIVLKRVKNKIVFSISDQGPGIHKKDRKRIFDKFTQAEFSKTGVIHGTGLGLTFCKMALELLKGRIWIEDNQKTGSIFLFSLPILNKKP